MIQYLCISIHPPKYDKICMLTSNAEIYPGKKHDILKIDVRLFMCALG